MSTPSYRCHDCKLKYKTDPIKRKKLTDSMACDYVAEKPMHQYKGAHNNKGNPGVSYNSCVGNYFSQYWSNFINYYSKFETGIMPFSGGLMDQPAKFVELMNLVHNLISEKHASDNEKQALLNRNRSHGRRSSKR